MGLFMRKLEKSLLLSTQAHALGVHLGRGRGDFEVGRNTQAALHTGPPAGLLLSEEQRALLEVLKQLHRIRQREETERQRRQQVAEWNRVWACTSAADAMDEEERQEAPALDRTDNSSGSHVLEFLDEFVKVVAVCQALLSAQQQQRVGDVGPRKRSLDYVWFMEDDASQEAHDGDGAGDDDEDDGASDETERRTHAMVARLHKRARLSAAAAELGHRPQQTSLSWSGVRVARGDGDDNCTYGGDVATTITATTTATPVSVATTTTTTRSERAWRPHSACSEVALALVASHEDVPSTQPSHPTWCALVNLVQQVDGAMTRHATKRRRYRQSVATAAAVAAVDQLRRPTIDGVRANSDANNDLLVARRRDEAAEEEEFIAEEQQVAVKRPRRMMPPTSPRVTPTTRPIHTAPPDRRKRARQEEEEGQVVEIEVAGEAQRAARVFSASSSSLLTTMARKPHQYSGGVPAEKRKKLGLVIIVTPPPEQRAGTLLAACN